MFLNSFAPLCWTIVDICARIGVQLETFLSDWRRCVMMTGGCRLALISAHIIVAARSAGQRLRWCGIENTVLWIDGAQNASLAIATNHYQWSGRLCELLRARLKSHDLLDLLILTADIRMWLLLASVTRRARHECEIFGGLAGELWRRQGERVFAFPTETGTGRTRWASTRSGQRCLLACFVSELWLDAHCELRKIIGILVKMCVDVSTFHHNFRSSSTTPTFITINYFF